MREFILKKFGADEYLEKLNKLDLNVKKDCESRGINF